MKQMRSIQTLVSSENCILNGEFDGIESINCDSFLVFSGCGSSGKLRVAEMF